MEGMDVSFKCMVPAELRDATGKEGFFHLYKNGSLVKLKSVAKGLPAATFSIKKVKRSDTGSYTCVYGKEKLENLANSKRSRPVYLHVTGSVTSPSLGAGVGSGVLVLLVLLIGGVLKWLQSKRDPAVQTEPVYATVNQPKQPSKQQDDTLTYSEINTARVTKKKSRSAHNEDNNQPKQPSKQQDDTLTYSEINTARVTKKKPSSAPDEDNVTYATVKSKV
ncbi:UNVERIFIED_CONTAM: hypothetical protein FKN15_005701 [Acipenser sinensis]